MSSINDWRRLYEGQGERIPYEGLTNTKGSSLFDIIGDMLVAKANSERAAQGMVDALNDKLARLGLGGFWRLGADGKPVFVDLRRTQTDLDLNDTRFKLQEINPIFPKVERYIDESFLYIGDDGRRYSDAKSLRRADEAFGDAQKIPDPIFNINFPMPLRRERYDEGRRDDWRFIPEKEDRLPLDYSALLGAYPELARLMKMKEKPTYSVSVSIDGDSTSTSVPIGEIANAVSEAIQRRAKLADITERLPNAISVEARRR